MDETVDAAQPTGDVNNIWTVDVVKNLIEEEVQETVRDVEEYSEIGGKSSLV